MEQTKGSYNGISIEDNLDFHNIICNDCIHIEVCKLPERIREFEFLKITGCKEFIKKGAKNE